METYIYAIATIAILIVAVLIVLSITKRTELPEPSNGQPVLDNQMNEWVFLRPLKDGTFLFRSPKGRMESITLGRCEFLGFCKKFDFEGVQKNNQNK